MFFKEVWNRKNNTDPEFMKLTHEVLSMHGMKYNGSVSWTNPQHHSQFNASIDDGHSWSGRTPEAIKHKDLAKDVEGIGWVPETEGHADTGSDTFQRWRHPEDYSTSLKVRLSQHPEGDPDARYFGTHYSTAEIV